MGLRKGLALKVFVVLCWVSGMIIPNQNSFASDPYPRVKIITGDFNGDGYADILYQEDKTSDYNRIELYIADQKGGFISDLDGAYPRWNLQGPEYQEDLQYDAANIIPGDFDGDGKTDFIRQEKNSWDDDTVNSFAIYFSRGTFSTNKWFPGDGHFEIVYPEGDVYQNHLRYDPGCNIIPGDFNGDGKTDFIRQERGGWDVDTINSFDVYFSRGNGYFDIVRPEGDIYQNHLRYNPGCNIIPGDFDGDGLTDFIRQERGGWDDDTINSFDVYFSRGNGYFDIARPEGEYFQNHLRSDPGCNIIPGDYNGDGLTDFIRQEKGGWDDDDIMTFGLYFSNGDGTFSVHYPDWHYLQVRLGQDDRTFISSVDNSRYDVYGVNIIPGNFNNDEYTDFLVQPTYHPHAVWTFDPPLYYERDYQRYITIGRDGGGQFDGFEIDKY